MSVCPSCNEPTSDPGALFCAYCGFALPSGRAGPESFPALAADGPSYGSGAASAQGWQAPAWASNADPRVVVVGLGALAAAVLLAIGLSYGPGSGAPDRAGRLASAPRHQASAPPTHSAGAGKPASPQHPQRAAVQLIRYHAAGYSFGYPSGWQVAQSDQPVASYRRTVLESANGTAKVTVDYSPGEVTDPAAKASQVEAATSRTPGYQRISFGPTTVGRHAAFAWDFMVADTDPRRADLFVRVPSGGFALLAHGLDVSRAKSAARSIAASLGGSP